MRHTVYLALRDLRALWRQPWFVAVTLVQPLIWLLLFGELFKSMADLPGFGSESYIGYLAPGIVVMSALFSSGWSGMATIEDINRGVTDRLLVSPVRRSALIAGRVAQSAVVIVVQSVIMVLIALAVGASFAGGVLGVVVLILLAALLGSALAALSNALALVTRQEESLIGAVTFLVLPLTFLSTALVNEALMPGWMQTVARPQPRRLGDRGRPQRHGGQPRLGPDRDRPRPAGRAAGALRDAGDARLPELSGERLIALLPSGSWIALSTCSMTWPAPTPSSASTSARRCATWSTTRRACCACSGPGGGSPRSTSSPPRSCGSAAPGRR